MKWRLRVTNGLVKCSLPIVHARLSQSMKPLVEEGPIGI